MIPIHHVLSVPLIPPDAMAAMKLRGALDEICARDESFSVDSGPVNEVILHGVGELALEQLVDRLKRGLGLVFTCGAPEVAYRETVTRIIEWDYTHKQRAPGQYAKVKLRFARGEPGSGVVFVDSSRDTVPAAFAPAIEAAILRSARNGPVAGFPLTELICTLIDGDYHEVDSTAATFEIAATACFREGIPKARPVVLEPMMRVVVLTPQDYMGDVVGDLNARRSRVTGMDAQESMQAITAETPVSNLFGYASTLKSMTHGRASCTMSFSHYEQAPHGRSGGDDPFAPAAALRG